MSLIRQRLAAGLLLILFLSACSGRPPLRLENGRVYPAPGGGSTMVAGVLRNESNHEIVITAIESPQAERVRILHLVSYESPGGYETERAEPLSLLSLPPKSALELAPNGVFFRVENLHQPLRVGEKFSLTIHLQDGQSITLTLSVVSP